MLKHTIFFIFSWIIICVLCTPSYAYREELSNGSYVDENGEIYDNKYDNTNIHAPWNNEFQKDNPFAPWNHPLYQDDVFAPWNNSMSDQRDTNTYLRENGEQNVDYYWKELSILDI